MSDDSTHHDSPLLELATLDEIMDELVKRYDGVLVVTNGEPGQDEMTDITRVYYGGGRLQALGMSIWASRYLSPKDGAFDLEDEEDL